MNWTMTRTDLRGVDMVAIRDKAGFLGHLFMARILPGPIRDTLEDKGSVEVEVKVKGTSDAKP